MKLTFEQAKLYEVVLADDTGRDARDVLRDLGGSQADKQAVADALGGPGAGRRDFS